MTRAHDPDAVHRLQRELAETRARLSEAEGALQAIHNGDVDALVLAGPEGEQIFTLQGAQEPYRLLIEQMSEGALTLSREGFILYANQALARLLQTPLERVIGAALLDLVSPEQRAALSGLIEAAWRGGSRGEVSVRLADGQDRPLRLGLSPLQVTPENLVCVVVSDLTEEKQHEAELRRLHAGLEQRVAERTAELVEAQRRTLTLMDESITARHAIERSYVQLQQEIAERRQAEAALQQSEAKYRVLVETTDTGFLILDRQGRVLDANPEYLRLAGHSQLGDIRGRSIVDWTAEHDQQRISEALAQCLGERKLRNFVVDYAHADGRLMSIDTNATVQGDGDALRIIALCRDITERRRLEEQIRQSEKMSAIGQLAGGIAHDYNNQLASINTFAELIRDKAEPGSDVGHFAQDILSIVKNTAGLTKNLLAFARKGKYRLGHVDLNRTVAGMVGILSHSIEKRISLRLELEAGSAVVDGDETQLSNAALNLALNARDAIADRGEIVFRTVILDLSTEEVARRQLQVIPGRFVELSVRDTGHGMTEEVKRRVFEPFFTTKPQGKGTGMGLAAVFGIVTNHHGAVTVESSPGAGSTFTLYLPLSSAGTTGKTGVEGATRKGKGHLLIVEDENPLLRSMSFMLEGLGYTVTTFSDGAQAIAFYRASWREVDLLLTDLSMPGLTGREVFLAAKVINPDVKAMLMSGYGMDADIQAVLDLGMLGFLEKPFSKEEASLKISEALNRTTTSA